MSFQPSLRENETSHPLKCFHKRQFELQSTSRVTLGGAVPRDLGHHRRTKQLEDIMVDKTRSMSKDRKIIGYGGENEERYHRVKTQENENITAVRLRRSKEHQAAEEDLKQHMEKRRIEKEHEMMEKRKDLEMLKDYYPWGAQGSGAPRITDSGSVLAQRQKFIETQSPPVKLEDSFDPFGKPGAGAPRRSDSGNVMASIVADPDTRFQKQLKREIEHSLRYKPNQIAQTKHLKRERSDSEKELILKEQQEKARYARRLEKQIMEEASDESIKPTFNPYFPWGKSHPQRDGSGKLLKEKRREEERDVGAWLNGLGEKSVQRQATKNKEFHDTNVYDPWGKPGGGAPLKTNSGEVVVEVFGNFENKKKEIITENNQALSTATWVGHGKVGQPTRDPVRGTITGGQSKQTSDITSSQFDIRRPPPAPKPVPYHRQNTLTSNQLLRQQEAFKLPYSTPPTKIMTTRNASRPKDSIQRLSHNV